jgi:hypothetical protein
MAHGSTKGVPIDIDPLLANNSDLLVPSQKAVKTYIDSKTLPLFLTGSVPFGNGTGLTENNNKFYWDNSLFKLKLTDSKLELLNSVYLGSGLVEYKGLSGTATLTIDQTNTSSSIGMWVKARAYNNTIGNGQTAGFIFGSVDGTDTTVGQVGMMWNTPNVSGAGNQLLIKNAYDSTGLIKIQANAYTQIDGLAIKQATTYTFSNSNLIKILAYPVNILRFNYGGTTGTQEIVLPYNAFLAIPDGYIVILKALNARGASPSVNVIVQAATGQTLEAFTFTADYASVVYRYDGTSSKWDIIAKY